MFLGHRIASLHTQFAFRHSEVTKLLTVFGLLQQLLTVGIEERHLTISLLHNSLNFFGFHHYACIFIRHGVTALLGSSLRHNHQRSRFLWQLILGGGTHPDDAIVHHLQANHLGLSTIRAYSYHITFLFHAGSQRRKRTHTKERYKDS